MDETVNKIEAPSAKAIAKATAIALVVALIILFAAVLPAEYGIDPWKTGKALGLTGLAESGGNSSGRAAAVAVSTGVFTSQPKIYKVDSEDFVLRPNEGVEMKYHMLKGAGMVYGWKADAKLAYEFHGEPDQKPSKDYFESYDLDDKVGKEESYGAFTAPSTGIHGWFWQNKTHKDVKFHLVTAGFYDSAKMLSGGPGDDVPVEDAK